jgi:RNA polymerase sigma factor (TIGR02999 family)
MSRCADGAFPDRARFMAYAARVMRGLIIDYVRNRQAQKRGGGFLITRVSADLAPAPAEGPRLQELGDALDSLVDIDAGLAEIVDLNFFCGFSFAEIAAMRGVSERTVYRQWERARIYLYQTLGARDTGLDETLPERRP